MEEEERERILLNLYREGLENLYSSPDFYDAVYQVDADYEKKEELIRENIEEGSKVLYLGCGTGNLIERLENEYEFAGVEPSEEMAEMARKKTSAEILVLRAEEIEFDEEFDAAVSFGQSMNYVLGDQEMEKVIGSTYDALKPGGILMFDLMTNLENGKSEKRIQKSGETEFSVQEKFKRKEGELFYLEFLYRIKGKEFSDKHTIRSWNLKDLIEILSKAGFSEIEELQVYDMETFAHILARR